MKDQLKKETAITSPSNLSLELRKKEDEIQSLKKELAGLKDELDNARIREAELEDTRRAMLFMMEDLNETQEAIIHSKEEWVKTFDGIWDPIFIHDTENRIIRANKAYHDEAGAAYDDIIGKKYWEVFPRISGPLHLCTEGESKLSDKEEVIDAISGKIFRVRCYLIDKKDASDNLFVHVMEDITEVKKVQTLLVQTAKLASIGELAANVAHEINNPMTAVLGYSSLILEDLDESSPIYEDLKVVEQESYRIKEIISNLLDFARQRKIKKKARDMNAIIRESVSLIGHMAVTSNISIELNLAEDIPSVEVDENQMKQVFLNLLGNAIHAMKNGGKLIITSKALRNKSTKAKNLLISFKDNGCGIPDEYKEKVFDPFFSSKGEGGTGLGLSVSYGIVKNHGGQLTLESEEGNGSDFSIHLPIINGDHKR